jgi:hemoglobin
MRPSLYEFAGGGSAFLALAAAHHARCLADPELNHPFSHPDQHPQHVERLAAYWAEVMGGPATYSDSCADQSFMLQMHAGNGDMTQFRSVCGCSNLNDLEPRKVDVVIVSGDDRCP